MNPVVKGSPMASAHSAFRWFVPSWHGDLRLEEKDGATLFTIEKPTPREQEIVREIEKEARLRGWWKDARDLICASGEGPCTLLAPITEVGPFASRLMRPGRAVLTALVFRDGEIVANERPEVIADLVAASAASDLGTAKTDPPSDAAKTESPKAKKDEKEEPGDKPEGVSPPKEGDVGGAKAPPAKAAKAAATVKRPTPSCPQCVPGSIAPAREVLLTFLNDEEHASWAKTRTIVVEGGLTGHRYLLAHRASEAAARIGRMCFDLDDEIVLHWHDWTVPPEEEVLSAKILLQHREHWMRHEASVLGAPFARDVFKNPFGNIQDGVPDADFTQGYGLMMKALGGDKKAAKLSGQVLDAARSMGLL